MPRRRAEDCLNLERHRFPSFNAPTRSAHSGKHSTGNAHRRRTEQRARRAMHDARRALTFVSQVRAARSLHPAIPGPAVGRRRAARAPGRARRRAWARTPGGGGRAPPVMHIIGRHRLRTRPGRPVPLCSGRFAPSLRALGSPATARPQTRRLQPSPEAEPDITSLARGVMLRMLRTGEGQCARTMRSRGRTRARLLLPSPRSCLFCVCTTHPTVARAGNLHPRHGSVRGGRGLI